MTSEDLIDTSTRDFACTICAHAIWARMRRFSVSATMPWPPRILVSWAGVIFRFLAMSAKAWSTRASGMTMPCFFASATSMTSSISWSVASLTPPFSRAIAMSLARWEMSKLVIGTSLTSTLIELSANAPDTADSGRNQGGTSDDAEAR